MPKFRKRTVVIEAEQFWPNAETWPDGVFIGKGDRALTGPWWLRTLNGVVQITPGEWVVIGVEGERYPCKPAIFDATYEPVEDDDD